MGETLYGPQSNSIPSCCIPTLVHLSSLQPPGPSQTRACREGVERGSIPPRAGPWKAGASPSLSRPWPAKPGGEGRQRVEFNSLQCFSGSCPRRIRPQPKRKNSWREARFLILCVCVPINLCVAGGVPQSPRADSRGRCCLYWLWVCAGMVGIPTDEPHHGCHTDMPEGTGRGKQHPLPQTPNLTGVRMGQWARPWVKRPLSTGAGQAWRR